MKRKKNKKWPVLLFLGGLILALNYNETIVNGEKTISFDKWYHNFMDKKNEEASIAVTEEADVEEVEEEVMV